LAFGFWLLAFGEGTEGTEFGKKERPLFPNNFPNNSRPQKHKDTKTVQR